jgi:hypothetical protein
VYRNGVKLGIADFTATSGTTVILASGATAGDLVETVSFFVSSVLNAIPAVANAVTETYINTGAVTQSKLGAGVAGTGPAFSAYASTSQTITSMAFTKVAINTELFDTNGNFDTSTNRFTPTVAGYYQVNGFVRMAATVNTIIQALAIIFKNGGAFARGNDIVLSSSTFNLFTASISEVVYLNGTTDYIELYGYLQATTPSFNASNTEATSRFSACLVRAA